MTEALTLHLRRFAKLCLISGGLWLVLDLIALVSMWSAVALCIGLVAYCLPSFWTQEPRND